MKQSKLFTKTQREAPKDEVSLNAQLLIRAGYIEKEMSGVYSFLPLGLRVFKKIQDIIREEINSTGSQEMFMTSLQNPELWKKTNRWDDEVVDVWFKTELKNGGELGLAATHEEPLVNIMKKHISSYKDLPVSAYQLQTKFRNETRAKSGLMRLREFIMKDQYSFHTDQNDLDNYYEIVKDAYIRIYEHLGIGEHTFVTYASGGMFSKYSHEFQTLTQAGEDLIYICDKCKVAINKEIIEDLKHKCPVCDASGLREDKAVEVGNIFKLGTKFSQALDLVFTDQEGNNHPVIMGCYGIGPQRLMGTICEIYNDEKGIIWPEAVAPFKVHLISLGKNDEAEKIYQELQKNNIEVLYDDREEITAGEKFADADLIGVPFRVIISGKSLEKGGVEVKKRSEKESKVMAVSELLGFLTK